MGLICTKFEYSIILELLKQTADQLDKKPDEFRLQIITYKDRNKLLKKEDPFDLFGGHLDYIEQAGNLFCEKYTGTGVLSHKLILPRFFLVQVRLINTNNGHLYTIFTITPDRTNILLHEAVTANLDPLLRNQAREMQEMIRLKNNRTPTDIDFLGDTEIFLECAKLILEKTSTVSLV